MTKRTSWWGYPAWMPDRIGGSDWYQNRMDRDWERIKSVHRWDRLADYNQRRSRGIVHTPEYEAEMREEQRLFNEQYR